MKITNEQEYNKALKRLDAIFFAPVGTPEGNEADELGKAIVDYEKEHYSIDAPTKEEYEEYLKNLGRQYDTDKLIYEAQ